MRAAPRRRRARSRSPAPTRRYRSFTTSPWCRRFSRPNQDGLRDDRVSIAYYLTKDAERVQVYLEPAQTAPGEPKLKYPIAEKVSVSTAKPGKAGYHGYDYDGGVDLNAEPPPDGDYIIYGEAEDKIGNRVVVSSTLTIQEGGKPARGSRPAATSTGKAR